MSEYFDRITANSQPHEVFSKDWSSYTTIEMAETFLPKARSIVRSAMRIHDGAELFSRVPKKETRLFPMKTKSLVLPSYFTFPKGVEISQKINVLKISEHELVAFFEIDEQNNILIKFRFGVEFKKVLNDFFKKTKQAKSANNIETSQFLTSKSDFDSFFKDDFTHYDLISFGLDKAGIETKKFKVFNQLSRKQNLVNLYNLKRNDADGLNFDAGLGINKIYPEAWAHAKIEQKALLPVFSEDEIFQIYYGNWLRDYSSIIAASNIGFDHKNKKTLLNEEPFKDNEFILAKLEKMNYKLTHQGLVEVIELIAVKSFVYDFDDSENAHFPDYEDEFISGEGTNRGYGELTKDILGVYRPEQHIDNPKGLEDESLFGHEKLDPPIVCNYSLPDSDVPRRQTLFVGIKDTSPLLDFTENLKNYIKVGGIPPDIRPSAFDFFSEQLKLAREKGRNREGFRHFGAALHVLEDYFAHTNFVEISMIKNSNKVGGVGINTHPWVELSYSIKTMSNGVEKAKKIDIVTGTFGSDDVVASILPKLAEFLFPTDIEKDVVKKSGDRTFTNRLIITVLEDFIRQESGMEEKDKAKFTPLEWTYEQILEAYQILLAYDDAILLANEVTDIVLDNLFPLFKDLRDYSKEKLDEFLDALWESWDYFPNLILHLMINAFAENIKDNQPTNYGTNPSHTQIAKDSLNNPLNPLAGYLAMLAVKQIGIEMDKCWRDEVSIESIIDFAEKTYFVHPSKTVWMDEYIVAWLSNNRSKAFGARLAKSYHIDPVKPQAKSTQELDELFKIK